MLQSTDHLTLRQQQLHREMSTAESTAPLAQEYKQDGPEALAIAAVIPYYPFHGVPRFYDISGMTHNPEIFQLCIDVFVRRYRDLGVDSVAGLDARGFVLGPPIALALKKPFIMIRKVGKLPNAVTGSQYYKEYQGSNAAGGDELCISRTAIKPGDRVLVIGNDTTISMRDHINYPQKQSYEVLNHHYSQTILWPPVGL